MASVTGNFLSVRYIFDHCKLHNSICMRSKPKFIKCCLEDGDPGKQKQKKLLSKTLNVVGLGSKRNAILDFCLDSPLVHSSSVEFWTMCSGATEKAQVFRKVTGNPSFSIEGANGVILDDLLLVEQFLSMGSIIVLVAGTGFGSDNKTVIKLLNAIKSNGGLAVSIIMKPFNFEGERRQREVGKLIVKLSKFSNMSIVVDSDALLKRETVTLTEALKTANNAVLLAIMSVSALLSDSYMKVLHVMPDQSKVVGTSDVLKILQHSGKAVVGFGAAYSVKASVERAAFDCPFLGGGLIQEMKDVVICVVASAKIMDQKDSQAAVCAFRQIAKSSAKIICATVLESTLEANVIVSTIIITGVESREATPNLGFWSQLSLRIPFPFALFWGGLSSKSTDGQATLLPKETSCSEKTLPMSQRTFKNDTQKSLIDDPSMTAECQDGPITFSSCNKDDNSGFKSQLSCTNKISAHTYIPTGINDVVGNHTIRKQISDVEDMAKMDQVESFSMSSEVACDIKGENISNHDQAQGPSSNYKSSLKNYSGSTSAFVGTKSQAMLHKLSPSNTDKANFSPVSVKDASPRDYLEGIKGNVIARITQNERATNIDESSDSQSIDTGLGCQKQHATGKSNCEIPILDKSTNINCHNTEFVATHAEGSMPLPQLMDKEGLLSWNEDLDLSAAQAWADMQGGSQNNSEVDHGRFPIGVKLVNEKNGNHLHSKYQAGQRMQMEDSQNETPQGADPFPWNGLADAGLNAMMDIYHTASALVLGNDTEEYRKQGSLSDRAASMLETERGSKRKWSPTIEMQYRGGIYRGRCQGGIPIGKGRLSYKDGSFYNGLWKHGKRWGTGAFYYSSGDVFQGSWREDLMHGKGWFYFKNGDRWFADFWKGKANGEGRYYSKDGDVFFGHFQDNWRHGKGLYIEPNGTRWYEIWELGVLVHRAQLESKEEST